MSVPHFGHTTPPSPTNHFLGANCDQRRELLAVETRAERGEHQHPGRRRGEVGGREHAGVEDVALGPLEPVGLAQERTTLGPYGADHRHAFRRLAQYRQCRRRDVAGAPASPAGGGGGRGPARSATSTTPAGCSPNAARSSAPSSPSHVGTIGTRKSSRSGRTARGRAGRNATSTRPSTTR